ncbi:hypothetical protein KQI63_05775 [bacterium]|nr:hypothetical protein [bacterium]
MTYIKPVDTCQECHGLKVISWRNADGEYRTPCAACDGTGVRKPVGGTHLEDVLRLIQNVSELATQADTRLEQAGQTPPAGSPAVFQLNS